MTCRRANGVVRHPADCRVGKGRQSAERRRLDGASDRMGNARRREGIRAWRRKGGDR